MRTPKKFLLFLFLEATQGAGAAEPIRPLSVPRGLPAPSVLPEAVRNAVADSFETVRRQLVPAVGAPAIPSQLPTPPLVPLPMPKFDAETQANIDESFTRFLMTSSSLSSLSAVGLSPTSPVVAAEPLPAELAPKAVALADPAPIPELLPSAYFHLAEDPIDPHSAVGVALATARTGSPSAADEETIFARVHLRYAEWELTLSRHTRTR